MSKQIVKQRPKPPPYPRPVPDLVIEDLAPGPADIAWSARNGAGHHVDENEKALDENEEVRRAAKRRRIEVCAQAYLRGEPLYIMSAQLKGPFNNGWKNPWAKRRKTAVQKPVRPQNGMEIPETGLRTRAKMVEEDEVNAIGPTPEARPTSRENARLRNEIKQPPSPFTSRARTLLPEPSPKVPPKVKERRVEEWLRTNETYAKVSDAEILVHSSPTPSSRRRRTPEKTPVNGNGLQGSQSEPPRNVSPMVDLQRSTMSLQARHKLHSPNAERRVQKLSRDMQSILAEPVVQQAGALQDTVRELTRPADQMNAQTDASRAEFAILKAKGRVLQIAPADAHMSPFEFRKVPTTGVQQVKVLGGPANDQEESEVDAGAIGATNIGPEQVTVIAETFNHGSKSAEDEVFATAPQPANDAISMPAPARLPTLATKESVQNQEEEHLPASIPRPMLSTAVSDVSTSNLLPSAQPRLEPQLSVSSAIQDDKMISFKPTTSVSDKPNETDGEQEKSLQPRTNINVDTENHIPVETNGPVAGPDAVVATSTPMHIYNAAELNTQELLANIGPLDLSTVKKPRVSTKQDTPVTVTKAKLDKKRKKTSFAADTSVQSSHGSIQDVMKAKISKQRMSPPLYLLGKEHLDIEVSDDENEVARKRLRQSGAAKTKGILKSTNASSSPTSMRKSKSRFTASRELAKDRSDELPIGSGQNGIDDDNFDLDAAIDDLGSFLGTWDAEKEASSLDLEL